LKSLKISSPPAIVTCGAGSLAVRDEQSTRRRGRIHICTLVGARRGRRPATFAACAPCAANACAPCAANRPKRSSVGMGRQGGEARGY